MPGKYESSAFILSSVPKRRGTDGHTPSACTKDDILHSVLVVSGSEQFDTIIRKSLGNFPMTDFRRNAAAARRTLPERYYDLVVINVPLRDETGEQLAFDIVNQCSAAVLLVVPSEIYENALDLVTDSGILAIAKPFPRGRLDKAIRFLTAVQERIRTLELRLQRAEEKAEEQRIIDRAKFYLIEKKQMTENEAHRYIGKQAMDSGISRRRIAERILDD